MKNLSLMSVLVFVSSFFLITMFSSCEDDPVNPDPPDPPIPEYVIVKVKAIDQNIMTARLYVPALDIYHLGIQYNDTCGIDVREIAIGFPYKEFHNTTQLIKVEITISVNGDGKAPYETTPLEQNTLIDEDKTIVFAL